MTPPSAPGPEGLRDDEQSFPPRDGLDDDENTWRVLLQRNVGGPWIWDAIPGLLARLEEARQENQRLRERLRYWFDCEQAMFEGMHRGGQTLAAGPFDEMQLTQRELMEMVGWKPVTGDQEIP